MTRHVADHHPDIQILKCNKCRLEFQSEAELNSHTANQHVFKCNDCSYEAHSPTIMDNHTNEKHSWSKTEDILLVLDSHANTVKPRTIERRLKGKLFAPCYSRPKEGRAYCSTSSWPNAKYPENSMETKVKELLKVRPYRGAVMMAPCNDISNIKDLRWEEQYRMAEKSALNTVAVVEEALQDFPGLERFLLLEYPPRADSQRLSNLSEFASFCLRETALKSKYGSRIMVKPLDCLNNASNYKVFGPTNRGPRFDGIHLRGKQGKHLFTNDIIFSLESACMTSMPTNSQENKVEEVATSNRYSLLN